MKTILNNTFYSKIFIIILAIPILFNCSKEDEPIIAISPPSINFSSTNFETTFFVSGHTPSPTVNWNGEQGIFSLNSIIKGVTINSNSGVISWSKELLLGINTIELIASNSAGQISINITIENLFKGVFKGGFNNNPNSKTIEDMNFYTYTFDSLGVITSTSAFGTETGKWEIHNKLLITEFSTYVENFDIYKDGTNAYIEGLWVLLPYEDGNPANGYVKLTLDK